MSLELSTKIYHQLRTTIKGMECLEIVRNYEKYSLERKYTIKARKLYL